MGEKQEDDSFQHSFTTAVPKPSQEYKNEGKDHREENL